jgi:hypothetical protein
MSNAYAQYSYASCSPASVLGSWTRRF